MAESRELNRSPHWVTSHLRAATTIGDTKSSTRTITASRPVPGCLSEVCTICMGRVRFIRPDLLRHVIESRERLLCATNFLTRAAAFDPGHSGQFSAADSPHV